MESYLSFLLSSFILDFRARSGSLPAMTGLSLMTASRFILYLYLFYISFFGTSAVNPDAYCFTGNGTLSSDLPCKTSDDVSFCCGVGWSCLSNGLCQWRDSTSFAEGTCTDKTFPANSCLGLCLVSKYRCFGFIIPSATIQRLMRNKVATQRKL